MNDILTKILKIFKWIYVKFKMKFRALRQDCLRPVNAFIYLSGDLQNDNSWNAQMN